MKKKLKKLFGVMLSFAMVLSLMPGNCLTAKANSNVASVTIGETTTQYGTISAALSAWTDGSTLTLLSDVGIENPIQMSSGTKTFNLNGHNITKTGDTGSVFCVRGGNLTVNGTGNISGGKGMNDGENSDYYRGGGFHVDNAVVVVNNVTITGNDASWGGGVFVKNTGSFTMNNSTISNNTTVDHHGAGWNSGGAAFIQDNATFIMNGGSVTGNKTTNGRFCGINNAGEGSFKVSGNAVINGNDYDGLHYNYTGRPITVIGELTEGANIHVSFNQTGVFTNTTDACIQYNDSTKFTSDDVRYKVVKKSDNQLYLTDADTVEVSFNTNGHGTAPANQTLEPGSLVTEPADPSAEGFAFCGWYKEEGCTNAWDFDNDTVTTATTLYAKWMEEAVVKTAPKAKTLTYTGSAQELVTAGTAAGGTMKYAVGENSDTIPTGGWSEFIPKRTEAGMYYVYYMVSGDTNHADSAECGPVEVEIKEKKEDEKPSAVGVVYASHIQNTGWEKTAKKNGEVSGSTGKGLRMEAMVAMVEGNKNLGIAYTAHVQDYGWMAWSANGEVAGTSGEGKRMEAIMMKLTGADKDKYDIYYRVHAQNLGWLSWSKNGEPAGTAGYGYRLEALQVQIVPKGQAFDKNAGKIESTKTEKYVSKDKNEKPQAEGSDHVNVSYKTHVQNVGWQAWKSNGAYAGTTGRSLRLEGIDINLSNKDYTGGVRYKTHIQNLGWEKNWKADGEMSGTSGRSLRLEAIEIELYGDMAKHYDVYYRVHAQNYGWMGWAKNGENAGTAGHSYRLEGIQVILVEKGATAPSDTYAGVKTVTKQAFISK